MMNTPSDELSLIDGLRERHVVSERSSETQEAGGVEALLKDGTNHASKGKKTYGRTPDGNGKPCKPPLNLWFSVMYRLSCTSTIFCLDKD